MTVRLPGVLRDAVGGSTKLTADGRTIREVIDDVERRFPGFRERIVDERGELRTYVSVFIGDRDARELGGAAASVPANADVMIIPAMAGGLAAR